MGKNGENKEKKSGLKQAEEALGEYNFRVDECDGASLVHKALRHLLDYVKELEARVKELEARPVNSGVRGLQD